MVQWGPFDRGRRAVRWRSCWSLVAGLTMVQYPKEGRHPCRPEPQRGSLSQVLYQGAIHMEGADGAVWRADQTRPMMTRHKKRRFPVNPDGDLS
jgi:hypothetical protein